MDPARVLVVANRTAATPALLDAVRERAAKGPCRFTLLVPNPADGPVEGLVGVPSPLDAIQDAVNLHGFDEIILSTLPQRVSRWLKMDLPSKLQGLGLPITTVTATGRE